MSSKGSSNQPSHARASKERYDLTSRIDDFKHSPLERHRLQKWDYYSQFMHCMKIRRMSLDRYLLFPWGPRRTQCCSIKSTTFLAQIKGIPLLIEKASFRPSNTEVSDYHKMYKHALLMHKKLAWAVYVFQGGCVEEADPWKKKRTLERHRLQEWTYYARFMNACALYETLTF